MQNPERRKALLTPIKNVFGHYKEEETQNKIAEISSEAAVALFALIAAIKAGEIPLVTVSALPLYQYSDDINLLQSSKEKLLTVSGQLPELSTALTTLKSEWRRKYLKTRIVMVTDSTTECDSNNHCTTTYETHPETEEYWDEPSKWTNAGLNHQVIDRWLGDINKQINRINYVDRRLPQTPTFIDGYDTYRVTQTELSKTNRNIVTTIGFSAAALGFAFYEEIIAACSEYFGGYNTFLSNVSQIRIKRRAVLKLIGGFLGAHKSLDWIKKFSLENSGARDNIEDEIKQTIQNMDLTDEQAVEVLFATNMNNIVNTHQDIQTELGEAVNVDHNNIESYNDIKPLLDNVISENSRRVELLKQRTQNDGMTQLQPMLVDVASHIKADSHIQEVAKEQRQETLWSSIMQVVMLIGAFAGIAFSQEVALAVSDTVYEKYKDNF